LRSELFVVWKSSKISKKWTIQTKIDQENAPDNPLIISPPTKK
jgi:hypothetical protein